MKWWVSWYATSAFEYNGPWWISGSDEQDRDTICAAVVATSETDARRVIENAHDDPGSVDEWRFVEPQDDGWSPFCDRFPEASWMKWPTP